MGPNRRYSAGIEGDLARAEHGRAVRGTPHGLSAQEVRRTGPRRDADEAIPVTALVSFRVLYDEVRELGEQEHAEAVAWTAGGAVLIRYHDESGEHHVWCFGAVVQRRS